MTPVLQSADEVVEELREDVLSMGSLVREIIGRATRALLLGDRRMADEVTAQGETIDLLESRIATRSLDTLAFRDGLAIARQMELGAILSLAIELERISDLAEEIAVICHQTAPPYPAPVAQRLRELADSALRSVELGVRAFLSKDLDDLHQLRWQRDIVEGAQRCLHDELQRQVRSVPGYASVGVGLLFASQNLKRIADHAASIGAWAVGTPSFDSGCRPQPAPTTDEHRLAVSNC
jgi:phosphate transport system protein